MKQKTEDYKLSAVTYYNNNDYGYNKTCNIFGVMAFGTEIVTEQKTSTK